MTVPFMVTDARLPIPPVQISGTGDNKWTAERCAMHRARVLKHLAKPIVLTDRTDRIGMLVVRGAIAIYQRRLVHAGDHPLNGRSSLRTKRESIGDRYCGK